MQIESNQYVNAYNLSRLEKKGNAFVYGRLMLWAKHNVNNDGGYLDIGFTRSLYKANMANGQHSIHGNACKTGDPNL